MAKIRTKKQLFEIVHICVRANDLLHDAIQFFTVYFFWNNRLHSMYTN